MPARCPAPGPGAVARPPPCPSLTRHPPVPGPLGPDRPPAPSASPSLRAEALRPRRRGRHPFLHRPHRPALPTPARTRQAVHRPLGRSPVLTVLTGATGFFGSHLLIRLLQRPGEVTALVRQDGDAGRRRLEHALRATGEPLPEDLHTRVRLLRADLTEPLLGLSPERHRELAGQADVIWHNAAVIDLAAPLEQVMRVNVEGTRRVLELASAAPGPLPRVLYTSSSYVAGGRLEGTVLEDDLDDRYGFRTPYEQSKYAAEQAVRGWAHDRNHPVTVLRPSVLTTDRALPRNAPLHPLAEVGARLSLLSRLGPSRLFPGATPDTPAVVEVPGRADAMMNLVPVEYAAEASVHVALRTPQRLVETFHLTHPRETPVSACLDAMRDLCPWLDLRVGPDAPSHTSEHGTQQLAQLLGGIHPYTRLHRTYDRTALLDALGHALPDPPAPDRNYL
ncbi:NAD-dependent epimerase/dehydratase family protein, partial [Streptomyces benahoarensis]